MYAQKPDHYVACS